MHFQGSDTGSESASSRGFSSTEPKKEISGTCLAEKGPSCFPEHQRKWLGTARLWKELEAQIPQGILE